MKKKTIENLNYLG